MKIKKEIYHKHTFYLIKNNCGLEITLCNYGASIYLIKYKGHIVTYHEANYASFLNSNKFTGKTLGRVAGRIKGGKLKIVNKTYQLEQNEKKNTLHGGKHCLSFKDFTTSVSEDKCFTNVTFKYISPNLEAGFPGTVKFVVCYSIAKNKNEFRIHYLATSNTLTPVSMAPHTYWRLLGKDVLNHKLTINGNEVTKLDKELIILGKEKAKKIYDFSREKKIGQDIKAVAKDNPRANGYDCGFILKKSNKPQIILKNNGIKLNIKTDMNMAIVYTNCAAGDNKMNGYGKDIRYGGVAIEPQMYTSTISGKFIDAKHPFDHYISFNLEDC